MTDTCVFCFVVDQAERLTSYSLSSSWTDLLFSPLWICLYAETRRVPTHIPPGQVVPVRFWRKLVSQKTIEKIKYTNYMSPQTVVNCTLSLYPVTNQGSAPHFQRLHRTPVDLFWHPLSGIMKFNNGFCSALCLQVHTFKNMSGITIAQLSKESSFSHFVPNGCIYTLPYGDLAMCYVNIQCTAAM